MTDSSVWPVLVVDDDEAVLQLSELILGSLVVDGRAVQVHRCSSAAQARSMLGTHRFALAIIDVVMETEHAGLDLIRTLRELALHRITPVVVRTGQPGVFPQARLLQDFRINDYWHKGDLTPERVRTVATGLIRAYATSLELEQLSQERAVLLKEIHHRVRNNLQTVASMLMLQRAQLQSDDGRSVLDESVSRVRCMALVHEHLVGSQASEAVDFCAYARALVDALRAGMAPNLAIRVQAPATRIPLSIDTALPLGLILNELLANAFKWSQAHSEAGKGVNSAANLGANMGGHTESARLAPNAEVQVEISVSDTELILSVRDAGHHQPGGFDAQVSTSLGLQIVRALARQLRGSLSVETGERSRFEFRCPRAPACASQAG